MFAIWLKYTPSHTDHDTIKSVCKIYMPRCKFYLMSEKKRYLDSFIRGLEKLRRFGQFACH